MDSIWLWRFHQPTDVNACKLILLPVRSSIRYPRGSEAGGGLLRVDGLIRRSGSVVVDQSAIRESTCEVSRDLWTLAVNGRYTWSWRTHSIQNQPFQWQCYVWFMYMQFFLHTVTHIHGDVGLKVLVLLPDFGDEEDTQIACRSSISGREKPGQNSRPDCERCAAGNNFKMMCWIQISVSLFSHPSSLVMFRDRRSN